MRTSHVCALTQHVCAKHTRTSLSAACTMGACLQEGGGAMRDDAVALHLTKAEAALATAALHRLPRQHRHLRPHTLQFDAISARLAQTSSVENSAAAMLCAIHGALCGLRFVALEKAMWSTYQHV